MIAGTPILAHQIVLGRSEHGRPILAWVLGDPAAKRRILVVGCIHGNESAGIPIADAIAAGNIRAGTQAVVVPNLNPDGVTAGTRQNARGVDLNRNFPYRWRPLSGVYASGPRALSERESRIAYRLIRRIRPTISIWFHQHLGVVDESGGDVRVERRFAALVEMPAEQLARYPGSVTSWENHSFPGTTSFAVELPAGPVPAARVGLFRRAILQLLAPSP